MSRPATTPPVDEATSTESAPPRRRAGPWIAVVLLAAGVVGLYLWNPQAESEAPGRAPAKGKRATPVATAPVSVGALTQTASYPGELDADAVDVAPTVAGRLVSVEARIGDRVEAGQELARVDDIEWRRQLAEATAAEKVAAAARRSAAVQARGARADLDRTEALKAKGVISQQQAEDARTRLGALNAEAAAAAAQQAQASARRDVIQQKLDEAVISAPFGGRIVARHKNPGAYVQPGAPIVRVIATTPLRVRFEVPERDVALFQQGARFRVQAPPTGERALEAVVTGVAGAVDSERRVVMVEGLVEGAPDSWLPGMYAVVLAPRRALDGATIVPAAALIERLGDDGEVERGVMTPAEGRARWVPVQVLARDGDRVAVEASLADGQEVLVSGQGELVDGAPIKVTGSDG